MTVPEAVVDRCRRAAGALDWTVTASVAGLLALAAFALVGTVGVPPVVEPSWVLDLLAASGPFAPLVFVALQALQVVVAPLPGQVLAGVGGYLFGGPAGAAYSLLGVVAGSSVVFLAAGRWGRPLAARMLSAETRERFEAFGAENGRVALFVFFLFPLFPDDALCVLAGLWDIRLRTFLALLVVGRAPSFLAAAYVGTSVYEGALGRLGVLLGASAVLVVAVHLGRDRIEGALAGLGGSGDS